MIPTQSPLPAEVGPGRSGKTRPSGRTRAGSPTSPLKGKGGGRGSFSLMKRSCPRPLVSSACLAGERGHWEPQAELQGKPPPTAAACAGASPSSCAAGAGLSVPRPPSRQSRPGAQELKKGRLKSTAGREPSPQLPRGQSRPSPGEPQSEHPHSLQIVSLAPLPKPRLIRATCPPGKQDSWLGFSCTRQVLALRGLSLSLRPSFPHSHRLSWGAALPLPQGPELLQPPKRLLKASPSEGVTGTPGAGSAHD